jgi:hypothetical protein
MGIELFNELRETMLEIQHIQFKIDQLKKYQSAGEFSNIRISFDSGQKSYILIQIDTDISLVNELRLLIQASIDLYEQQILDLKLNF